MSPAGLVLSREAPPAGLVATLASRLGDAESALLRVIAALARLEPVSGEIAALAAVQLRPAPPCIRLTALPVHRDSAGHYVTRLGLDPPHGFKNDPVLGLVENLNLHGAFLSAAKIYVGVLAATILFIATNAGVIGASRITYSMSSYRQLPEVFRRLHPKFKTPWLSLLVFAGFASILVLLPGQVAFLGTMY